MELNSTQEKDVGDTTGAPAASSQEVDGQHQSPSGTPAATQPAIVDKKTTIQLFTSTTIRLTSRKTGNDTYNDVINRDLDKLGCPSAEQIVKAQGGQ
jgi:hypothetical protein